MKPLKLAVLLCTMTTPVFADHANPWATDGDALLSKNHDTNQAKSANTPGEDEMRGAMKQTARGKLDGLASDGNGTAKGSRGTVHGKN